MQNHIFYDGTVYTGSAGLAMYYFLSAQEKNGGDDTLKVKDKICTFVNT